MLIDYFYAGLFVGAVISFVIVMFFLIFDDYWNGGRDYDEDGE